MLKEEAADAQKIFWSRDLSFLTDHEFVSFPAEFVNIPRNRTTNPAEYIDQQSQQWQTQNPPSPPLWQQMHR